MTYKALTENYVHPFVIYVIAGTLISYLAAQILTRFPALGDARTRAFLFGLPFAVPFVAFLLRGPISYDKCYLDGHKLGFVNDWICTGANIVAAILTPIFGLAVIFAFFRVVLATWAYRKFKNKYGFACIENYSSLFLLLKNLCCKSGLDVPRVVVTDHLSAKAFIMGYRKPVLVLSQGLISNLDEDELETVIAHELGHIARKDSLSNWVTVTLRDLMFFAPHIFLMFRDFSLEKEKAADDFAISLTGKPMAFAQALIKVWRLSSRTLHDNFVPYTSFVNKNGILEHRVKRLVNERDYKRTNNVIGPAAFSIAATITTVALYMVC